MADFCWDCFADMFEPHIAAEKNDLAGIVGPYVMVHAICEGCGEGWFDQDGKRVPIQEAGEVERTGS